MDSINQRDQKLQVILYVFVKNQKICPTNKGNHYFKEKPLLEAMVGKCNKQRLI